MGGQGGVDYDDQLFAWFANEDPAAPPPVRHAVEDTATPQPPCKKVSPEEVAHELLRKEQAQEEECPAQPLPHDTCERCHAKGIPLRRDCPGDMICRACWDGYYKGSRLFNVEEENWLFEDDESNRFRGSRTTVDVQRKVVEKPVGTAVEYEVVERTTDYIGPPVLPATSPDSHLPAAPARFEGSVLFENGRHEEAVESYSRDIARFPGHAILRCNRSAAYLQLGHFAEAEADAREALQLDPVNWKAHFRLASALFYQGRWDEVVYHLDEAGKVEGDTVPISALRAMVEAKRALGGTEAEEDSVGVVVREVAGKGRCSFAARPFRPGEAVIREAPLLMNTDLKSFADLASGYCALPTATREAVKSLCGSVDELKGPDREHVMSLAEEQHSRLSAAAHEEASVPSPRELADLFVKHNWNALGGRGRSGLYPRASLIEHSCLPNLAYEIDDDGCVNVTAIRSISVGDALCLEYGDSHRTEEARNAFLQHQYNFTCTCDSCAVGDRARAFDCPTCSGQVYAVREGRWRCNKCKKEMPPEEQRRHHLMEKLEVDRLPAVDIDLMLKEGFHVSHWAVKEAALAQARTSCREKRWGEAEAALRHAVASADAFYPSWHPQRASPYELLAQVLSQMGKGDEARAAYATAHSIKATAHGEGSRVVAFLAACEAQVPDASGYGRLASAMLGQM